MYNHKDKIKETLIKEDMGISAKPLSYSLDDFNAYNRAQKMISRHQALTKKKMEWDAAEQELRLKQEFGVQHRSHTWEIFTAGKLTDLEESELDDLDTDLYEDLLELKLRELSIEQWSFIKSLYPSLDEVSFFQIIASLSKGFMAHLNTNGFQELENNENCVIKNKFINHCNLLAGGVIKFEKKSIEENKQDSQVDC